MPNIKITIIGADKKLSEKISNSISDGNGYKYTYMKQLVARLRIVQKNVRDQSEENQLIDFTNALIAERNIANFSAERYAELNQEEIFDALIQVTEAIEDILSE